MGVEKSNILLESFKFCISPKVITYSIFKLSQKKFVFFDIYSIIERSV
jgi:hypothetical protein